MGLQQEDAVLNVRVNGEPAAASIKEMTGQIKYLTTAIEGMHKADNPALYASRVSQLRALTAARDAERTSIKQTTAAVQEQQSQWSDAFNVIKTGIAGLGIAAGVGMLVSFGKELLNIQKAASGVERAFARIGDTSGLIDKLRAASRNMISDLDLQKLAVQANNFNVPLSKLPLLLEFAAQRARDTGQDVTTLTDKLIQGLGKSGARSLNALGISSKELNDELKHTPDRIEAIAKIIERRMADAGAALDNFGDNMEQKATRWANFKNKAAQFFGNMVSLGTGGMPDASPEDVQNATNIEIKRFGDIEKMKDKELDTAIANQRARVKKLQSVKTPGYDAMVGLIGAQNALSSLNNQKANNVKKAEEEGTPGTVEYLEKQIGELKRVQKEVSNTSAEWKNYQDKIDDLQKAMDRITGKKTPGDKKAESEAARALKDFQKLAEEQKQFEASDLADHLLKNQKEIAQEQNKYDVMIQKEKDFLKEKGTTRQQRVDTENNIARLEAEKAQAVIDLRVKQEKDLTDKINGFRVQMSGKLETELAKEIDQINKFYAELAKTTNDPADQAKIEAARAAEITDAKLREATRFEEESRKIEEQFGGDPTRRAELQKAAIRKKYEDEIAALKEKFSKEFQETKAFQDLIKGLRKREKDEEDAVDKKDFTREKDAAIQGAQTISDAVFQIAANNRNAELDGKLKQLEEQRNAELANQNLTQTQKDSINQRFARQEAEVKKQAWKAEKAAAVEQALINGALAVARAFADYAIPYSYVVAGLAAVSTGAQVAVIESQPEPQFAQGGILPQGPGHASGGIDLVGPYGRVLGQVEGGEPILSRSTYANNRGIVNALLQSRGGPVDYEKINQATTRRDMRGGGGSGSSSGGGNVTAGQQVDIGTLVEEMRLTRMAVEAKEFTINRRAWDTESDRVEKIRNNAKA